MKFVFASEFTGPKWAALKGVQPLAVLVSYWFSIERDESRGLKGLINALAGMPAKDRGSAL